MKFYAIGILVLAVLGFLTWGGHSLYESGYNKRVSEESKAYADAEARGQKDQAKADADTIAQLQGQVDQANADATTRQHDLDAASQTLADLKRRLANDQNPDNRRWLDMPLPCGLQQPPACPSAPAGNPGH